MDKKVSSDSPGQQDLGEDSDKYQEASSPFLVVCFTSQSVSIFMCFRLIYSFQSIRVSTSSAQHLEKWLIEAISLIHPLRKKRPKSLAVRSRSRPAPALANGVSLAENPMAVTTPSTLNEFRRCNPPIFDGEKADHWIVENG